MYARLLAASFVLALASCSKSGSEPGQNMSAEDVAEELSEMKIQPGQWQATNEILSASSPGVPPEALKQMIGQKNTASNCITPEEAAKPNASFLAAQDKSDCTYQDWKMDDGKMSGTMSCSGGQLMGKMVLKMDGTYGPESYAMTMDMNTSGLPGGLTMNIKAKTTGKRLGECTESGAEAS